MIFAETDGIKTEAPRSVQETALGTDLHGDHTVPLSIPKFESELLILRLHGG
jgi:hypothetical protein